MECVEWISRDRRTLVVGTPLAVVLLLLWMGFGALSIASCLSSLFIGYHCALWLASASDGNLFSPLADAFVESQKSKSIGNEREASSDEEKIRKMPWQDLLVSEPVSDSLEQLLEQIVDKYVNNWYEAGISRDRAFLHEIKYQLRFVACSLLRRMFSLDLPQLIVEDLIPVTVLHVHKVVKAEETIDKQNVPPSLLEAEIAKKMIDLHFALGSRANEADYLRQVTDFLLPRLLDDARLAGRAHDDDSPTHSNKESRAKRPWPSHSCRHFLRELVVNAVLLPLLDLVGDPDTINYLLCLLFDPEPAAPLDTVQYPLVPFLHGLTEQANETVPDSLLQLKLSELLRDAKQFSMFRLFLQDTRGPVNELIFLAETDRIHGSMQRKAENSSQIAYDIWQLYGQFVHESAPEKIDFGEEIVQEFHAAIESNNLEQLEKIVEKTYQKVYSRLQFEYVVPFCQSETFMGHLCGSPPVSLDDILHRRDKKRNSLTEKPFSLAQFRSRLRKAIALSFDEEETEQETNAAAPRDITNTPRFSLEQGEEAGLVLGSPLRPRAESAYEAQRRKDDAINDELPSPLTPLTTPPAHSRSMPDFQMPSIDVELCDDDGLGAHGIISPASAVELRDDESSGGDSISGSSEIETTPTLVIDHETRDINRWSITIPRIIPTRDPVNGRTIYVYVIEVDRHDAQPHETKTWTVIRRFNEFYVLEAKLNEFHGDSLHAPTLPPRKTFVTKTRAFIEQHRLCFASFLLNLCRQRMLCRSDLLFAFMTSNEEFRDSLLLSDLNPWKVVKKMPGKLSRERGQNLRPFLLNLLANTLSPPEKAIVVIASNEKDSSESSSLSSFSAEGQPPHSLYSVVYGNNFTQCRVGNECVKSHQAWTRSFCDSLFLLCRDIMDVSSHWVLSILSSVRLLSRYAIDTMMKGIIQKVLKTALHDTYLVQLIHLIEQSLFCSEGIVATEQEKLLRQELAMRRSVEWLEETVPSHLRKAIGGKLFRTGTLRILQTIQYPRLNKQLSYVLLDVIVKRLFPNESQ